MAIQFVDGDVLFVSGDVAMHADCCCSPCSECSGAQPPASVTVNACVPPSIAPSGPYTFDSFTSFSPDCSWLWTAVDGDLDVVYFGNDDEYTIELIPSLGSHYFAYDAALSCVGGDITGTVILVSEDDITCTASVTFG